MGLLFYPIVVNFFAGRQNATAVQNYQRDVKKLGPSRAKRMLDAAKLYNARLYNEYIYDASQHIAWQGKQPSYYQTLDVAPDGMMGYIDIPQIRVKDVPIYHGDDEKTLALGVGHIPETSLPIGGANTHAVLPAHSGRVNDTLFTDLDKLKKGDVFYIRVLSLDLKYKVTSEKIVAPNQVSSLNVVKGQDLVTLVTCWPTGINNKRLLVTGKRAPLSQTTPEERSQRNFFGYNFWVMAASSLLALLGLLYVLVLSRRGRLYHIATTAVAGSTALTLADSSTTGDFGRGVYLYSSRGLARREAKGRDILVYRLKKRQALTRWIFKSRSENWQKYVEAATADSFADARHELVAGPLMTGRTRARQYKLTSDKALQHLKYIKKLKTRQSKR